MVRRPTLACLFVLTLSTLLAGCEDESAPSPPDGTYTVRGAVQRMPSDGPGTEIHIKHEAIPEFKGRDGKVKGMKPMSMPFEPGPDLKLDGLSQGDKIKFTFEVRWDARPMLRVTEIDELPRDTKLDLGRKKKTKGGADASDGGAASEGGQDAKDASEAGAATDRPDGAPGAEAG